MPSENIATVNILKICRDNFNEIKSKIEQIENEIETIQQNIKKINLDREHKLKELKKEKQSIDQAIQTIINANSIVPADIKRRVDDLCAQIEFNSDIRNFCPEIDNLDEKLKAIKEEIKVFEEKKISWEKKIDIAERLSATVKVKRSKANFYTSWDEIIPTSKTSLRLGASNVLCFENLEELIEEYCSGVPIVISVNENYVCEKLTVFGICENLKATLPVGFAKVIPKDLKWITSSSDTLYKNLPIEGIEGRPISAGNGIYIVCGDPDPSPDKEAYKNTIVSNFEKYKSSSLNLNETQLFYIRSLNKFYSINPKRILDVKLTETTCWSTDRRSHSELVVDEGSQSIFDGSGLFDDFIPILKNSNYYHDILLKRINRLSEALFSKEKFIGNLDKRLSEIEIKQEIGIYWDAFVNSPWDINIPVRGRLRMLKHLCMRKSETPDICSTQYKGYYRFNLRTRDHTWIIGKIFCQPSSLNRRPPINSDEVQYEENLVQVGDALILIEDEIS